MTDPDSTSVADAGAPDPIPRFRPLPANAVFRVPSIDAGEGALVDANDRARAHSATVLRRLLPELDPSGPKAAQPQPVDRARLARLFDLDVLDELVDHGVDRARVGLSNLAFLGDGANVSLPPSDVLHGALIGRAMRDGGRVVLAGLERTTPAVRRLAEHLGRVFAARVAVRAVAGSGAFSGETTATLRNDHLLVPVVGQRYVTAEIQGGDRYDGPLGPGQALHLPAGATLTSHPANELFVLLEVQIDPPSPRNVLPTVADGAPATLAWSDDLAALRDQLVARWLAHLPTLPATRFSRTMVPGGPTLQGDGWLRSVHTGGWCRLAHVTDDPDADVDADTIVAAGIALSIPAPLWALLADGLAGSAVPLSSVTTDERTSRLVALLVDAGLCELLPEQSSCATWDAEDGDAVIVV